MRLIRGLGSIVVAFALVFVLFLATATPTLGGVKADDSNENPEGCAASKLDINVYVERDNLVLAVGEDAIHSHDFTRDIFKIAWKSDALRDLREAFEASGYQIIESQSVVVVNVSAGGAIVIIPIVLEADPGVTDKLVAVVDVHEQVVVGTLVGSEAPSSHVTCIFWFCINWCEVIAAAIIAACVTGCVAACLVACIPFPPACPFCAPLCLLCGQGFPVIYDACVNWLH